jgi:hypothetical protein
MDSIPCPICGECQWDVDDCITVAEVAVHPNRTDIVAVLTRKLLELTDYTNELEGRLDTKDRMISEQARLISYLREED